MYPLEFRPGRYCLCETCTHAVCHSRHTACVHVYTLCVVTRTHCVYATHTHTECPPRTGVEENPIELGVQINNIPIKIPFK